VHCSHGREGAEGKRGRCDAGHVDFAGGEDGLVIIRAIPARESLSEGGATYSRLAEQAQPGVSHRRRCEAR
jgi:hypothetical protein